MFKNTYKSNLIIILSVIVITFSLINMNIFNLQNKFLQLDFVKNIFFSGTLFFIVLGIVYLLHTGVKKITS